MESSPNSSIELVITDWGGGLIAVFLAFALAATATAAAVLGTNTGAFNA